MIAPRQEGQAEAETRWGWNWDPYCTLRFHPGAVFMQDVEGLAARLDKTPAEVIRPAAVAGLATELAGALTKGLITHGGAFMASQLISLACCALDEKEQEVYVGLSREYLYRDAPGPEEA